MDHKEIRGLISAVVTPFKIDGSIDHKSLADHVARVASAKGLYGVAVSGHAGEVLTLTSEERIAIVATAKKVMPKGVKLVAGIESRSIAGLVNEGLIAKNAGADMLLVLPLFDVRPYRHLCHQPEAVYSVFERMDREVGLPMIVFQYPEATGCAYSLASLQRIASLPSVVGIKAATVTATKYAEINDALNDKVAVLAACDAPSLLGMLLHNAPGALLGISVVGTQQWVDLVREATIGDARKAKEIHNNFAVPLMDAIYEYQLQRTPISSCSANKEALVQLGEIQSSWVRPPALSVDKARKESIRLGLQKAGLLMAKSAVGM
jgi:4-hydroxy-tetrahydrodipicolinate synthase